MLSKSNRGGKNLEDSYNRCFIQMLLFDNEFDWTRKGQKKQEKKLDRNQRYLKQTFWYINP